MRESLFFSEKPQKINKHGFLSLSDKAFKGTVLNRALSSLHI